MMTFMPKVLLTGLSVLGLSFTTSAQDKPIFTTLSEAPPENPTYREGAPIFTAQDAKAGDTVYDSYWIHDGWKIHCWKTEFCYIQLKLTSTGNYPNGKVLRPLVWDRSRQFNQSLGVSIANNTPRLSVSAPFFTFEGVNYGDNSSHYSENGYPDMTALFLVDDKEVARQHLGPSDPLNLKIYQDLEPESAPALTALMTNLYWDDPKELEIRLRIDGKSAIGIFFDLDGFKGAYDAMVVEHQTRQALKGATHLRFESWPTRSN